MTAVSGALAAVVALVSILLTTVPPIPSGATGPSSPAMPAGPHLTPAASTPTPVANFTAAIQRMVSLLALSGSGLLAIVWARVALSWFSNDVTKKVQAKDRARDALVGTVIFVAAISGLLWGVAHWVVTGT